MADTTATHSSLSNSNRGVRCKYLQRQGASEMKKFDTVVLPMLVSFFCLSRASAAQDGEQDRGKDVVAPGANAKQAEPELSLVAQEGEVANGNNYSFEFGPQHLMDPRQKLLDMDARTALKWVMDGLKHDFILQNRTQAPLAISDLEVKKEQYFMLQAAIVKDERPQGGRHFLIEPGAEVRVRVAFNYYMCLAGPQALSVRVMSEGSKSPLAVLTMKAMVSSGIELSPDATAFGKVVAGKGASRNFTLLFHPASPDRIPPTPLRILSNNPHVKITAVPEKQTINEVEVSGDQILFPKRQIPHFKEALVLNFRAVLSPGAPVGPLEGEVRLLVVDAPEFLIVRDATAPITGEVIAAAANAVR
jgi:hypothetical protein